MAKTIVIELRFDRDDIQDDDVYTYLNEMMENYMLYWEVKEE